jgi:hypothetical protein
MPHRKGALAFLILLLLWPLAATGQQPARDIPRMADGRPNLNGIWQTLSTAHWDIEDHPAYAGPMSETGAIGAAPAGRGVVDGGPIPYRPAALEQRDLNFANRRTGDPEARCFMPGVPRANYMPYPFQIVQSDRDILMVYEYATSSRMIHMGEPEESLIDTWMGTNNGRWNGDTLVVEVTGLNGLAWLDRAGNFVSNQARIEERYTPIGNAYLRYEARIEDPTVFTRPWEISLLLYKRVEPDAQLMEFKCVEFAEELLYGDLTKD